MAIATGTALALAATAAGAATSYAGAKKNAAAARDAAAMNAASVNEANRLNYQRWLESQGVGPNGEPVNVNLPRYFTTAPVGQTRRFRRASSVAAPVPASDPNAAI